jgi:hypothetical protein
MKKILLVIFILMPFYSCNKDKTEYISHDSEIFFEGDTILIGKWDYLYTWSGGGYTGVSSKSFENRPTLNIKLKGKYELLQNGNIILTGIIDTLGFLNKSVLVIFYPNGIKAQNIILQTLQIHKIDTLILGIGAHGDWFSEAYYKRSKD